jgi:hypothetical protein
MSTPIQPNRRAFVRTALATLGAVAMSDSNGGLFGPSETKPPYPVKSSGLVFGRGAGNLEPVYWLDNERAMFAAHAPIKVKEPNGQEKISGTPLGIYIWNVKTNTFKRYADLTAAPRLFNYNRGEIAYMVENIDPAHGVISVMIGKMGEEKRVTILGGVFSPPELEPSEGPGERIRHEGDKVSTSFYALLPQHGYINVCTGPRGEIINKNNQNDHLKLYRPRSTQPIELPILAKEMWICKFSYSDYLGKYVLLPGMSRQHDVFDPGPRWKRDEPIPIYLISPDGHVETLEIPTGYWHPHAVYPTRQGLLWVSNDTVSNSRDAGGWLLKDGKVTKLFDQLVDGAGVSPDGCTIVYANNDFNPKTTEYVQAIDLCASPNKK